MSSFLKRHGSFIGRYIGTIFWFGALVAFLSIFWVTLPPAASKSDALIGYVVALDEHGKPALCWPVPERSAGEDIYIQQGGVFCFNGERGACSGSGAVAVSPPALAWNPAPVAAGRVWLAGLGIVSCPGGRLP